MITKNKIPFTVGCIICETRVRKDGFFGNLFLFWLPEMYKVQLVMIGQDGASMVLFSTCEKCYNLATKDQELFVTLLKARFSNKETHE